MTTETVPVAVLTVQRLLLAAGEQLPIYGADGRFSAGGETDRALKAYEARIAPPAAAPKPVAPAIVGGGGSGLWDGDVSALTPVRPGILSPQNIKAFVWHHTGGRGTAASVQGVLRDRTPTALNINLILDRDGKMWLAAPWMTLSYHAGTANRAPWSALLGGPSANARTMGCETIAKVDGDVLPVQVERAKRFAVALEGRFPGILHIGHGELTTRKLATEGLTIARAIRISDTDCRIRPELLREAAR